MKSSVFQNVLGVDLGTTNSVVTASIKEGVPEILESYSGKTTPSCLMFNNDGSYEVGKKAYKSRHRDNVVYSFKKYMGTTKKVYGDLTARDCSRLFLKKLLEEVKELNPQYKNFNSILVSVPAYFDINQVEDTKRAIKELGYEVFGVEKEPISAALVYQKIKRVTSDFLVFDLGGGTFDAVLIRNTVGIPQDSREFYKELGMELPDIQDVLEVLDVSGDNNLGGDDIDKIAVKKYVKRYNLDPTKEEYQKLLLVAERSKKLVTDIEVDFTGKSFEFKLVEEATLEVFKRCKEIMMPMLQRSKTFNVHCVLCGGSTKSHIIREELSKLFTCSFEIDPDLAVGIGNSVKVNMARGNSGTSIVQRLAKGVGILSDGKIKFIVNKGEIIPLHYRFEARNAKPFDTNVHIALFQGENALSKPSPVSVVSLTDIEGHDAKGYARIVIDLFITNDSTITVTVTSGEAHITSELSLTEVEEEDAGDINVHKDAKYFHRFLKAAERYDNDQLYDLLEHYRMTGDGEVAKEIMALINELAG